MKLSRLRISACVLGVSVGVAGCVGILGDFSTGAPVTSQDGSTADSTAPGTDSGAPVDSSVVTDSGSSTEAGVDGGPFDANFYGNLELWLSGDVGVVEDGGTLISWTDRSLKARTVSLGTSGICSKKPSVMPSSIHGLATLTFDGTFQCMEVSGEFNPFTGGLTSFAVILPGTCNSSFLGSSGAIFDSYDNAGGTYTSGVRLERNPVPANNATGDGQLTITDTAGTGSVGISGGGSWVPGTPALLEFRLPAAPGGNLVAGTAFVNGTAATLGTNMPLSPDFDNARTMTFVGYNKNPSTSYPYYCGQLGELLVFSKALTDADRVAVENYLRTRWGL